LYIDENVVRLIALQVIMIVFTSLRWQLGFPLFVLFADFVLRAFTGQPSPLAAVAKVIVDLLKLQAKPQLATPKKFAAGIGSVLSLSLFILVSCHQSQTAKMIGSIIILFALLEAVFTICVGCYIFNLFVAPFKNKKNNDV
ncbi:MAG: DUF4395 domain-containing protein, partial [Bacteroidota bacterium]